MNLVKGSLLLAVCLAVSSFALAVNGATTVYQPTTIDTPGSYVVTRDISSAQVVLHIMADDVTVDLAGHTLTGTSIGSAVVLIEGRNIVLRNGRITGGNTLVSLPPAPRQVVRLERLTLYAPMYNYGIDGRDVDALDVVDCTFRSIGAIAINAHGGGVCMTARIRDNLIDGVKGDAIRLNDVCGGRIEGNQIRDYGQSGAPAYGVIVSNSSSIGGRGAVSIENNAIWGSLLDEHGITLSGAADGSIIRNNRITDLMNTGIYVYTSGTRIAGNTVTACQNGMVVYDANHLITDNVVQQSRGYALISYSGTNIGYRDNVLHSDAGIPVGGSLVDLGGNLQ
jgi:parallel beta-helix repeat protein